MKKFSLIILIIFCLIIKDAFPQIAFYDAIALSKMTSTPTSKILDQGNDSVFLILKNYVPDSAKWEKDKVINCFNPLSPDKPDPNPFITISGRMQSTVENLLSSSFKTITPLSGNIDFTNIADGLAMFLVKRSKEELNVAFFTKFQEYLSKYPEIRILSPATYGFLQEINSYEYTYMLPAFREAFVSDFNNLILNLINLRDTSKYVGYETEKEIKQRADEIITTLNTPAGRIFIAALLSANGISQGNSPSEIITDLCEDRICSDFPDDNLSNMIRFAELLSRSLRSSNKERIWVTASQLNELVYNKLAFQIYLGLMYASDQKNEYKIKFSLGTSSFTLQQFLTDIYKQVFEKEAQIEILKLGESLASLTNKMTELEENYMEMLKENEKDKKDIVLRGQPYFSVISDFIKLSLRFITEHNSKDISNSKLAQDALQFTSVANSALGCFYDIKARNYSSLVLNTSVLLTEALGKSFDFKEEYMKYGIFMANIIGAENSEEVSAAIEAAVLPVGSSSVKRETNFSVSLNGYIGPGGGIEYLPVLKEDKLAYVAGITAPVGVAINWGNIYNGKRLTSKVDKKGSNGQNKGGKSLSIFLQVIDVGALATFRLGNDSSNVASEVEFTNIFSPGLYGYFGFGKCPVSIGVGGQLGPQLRSVSASDINIDKNYYFKFGINIVIDIPLFNFYIKN